MSIKTASGSDFIGLTSSLPNKVGVTIMLWANMASGPGSSNTRSMVSLSDGGDDCWDLEMSANVGDSIDHFGSYSSGPSQDQLGSINVTKSAWHHLAITISAGGVLKSYVDGVADITAGGSSTSVTPTALRLGQSAAGDATWAGWSAYGLKIWNAELSAAEVLAEKGSYGAVRTANLYGSWLLSNVTSLTDSSGNGHTLTRSGSSFTNDTDPPQLSTAYTLGLTDAVALSEASSRPVAFAKHLSDSIAVSETFARAAALHLATGDSITLSDSSLAGIARLLALADALALSDALDAGLPVQLFAPGSVVWMRRLDDLSPDPHLVPVLNNPMARAVASEAGLVLASPQVDQGDKALPERVGHPQGVGGRGGNGSPPRWPW